MAFLRRTSAQPPPCRRVALPLPARDVEDVIDRRSCFRLPSRSRAAARLAFQCPRVLRPLRSSARAL
eukprot:2529210-Pleurochrysis_carterae.AAC.1